MMMASMAMASMMMVSMVIITSVSGNSTTLIYRNLTITDHPDLCAEAYEDLTQQVIGPKK